MRELQYFMSGAVFMAYVVAGMFFLKFLQKTRDRFFLWFAAAFFIFALVRVALSYVSQESELRGFLYLGRALAVLLILVAIVLKNRPRKTAALPER